MLGYGEKESGYKMFKGKRKFVSWEQIGKRCHMWKQNVNKTLYRLQREEYSDDHAGKYEYIDEDTAGEIKKEPLHDTREKHGTSYINDD